MKYVACCSFGKDSLATVILAKRHNFVAVELEPGREGLEFDYQLACQ